MDSNLCKVQYHDITALWCTGGVCVKFHATEYGCMYKACFTHDIQDGNMVATSRTKAVTDWKHKNTYNPEGSQVHC